MQTSRTGNSWRGANARAQLNVGDRVAILRNGRPWRTAVIQCHRGERLVLDNGFAYSTVTGRRTGMPVKGAAITEVVVPWHPNLEDHLVLKQLRRCLAHTCFAGVEPEKLHRLASLAQEFMGTLEVPASNG